MSDDDGRYIRGEPLSGAGDVPLQQQLDRLLHRQIMFEQLMQRMLEQKGVITQREFVDMLVEQRFQDEPKQKRLLPRCEYVSTPDGRCTLTAGHPVGPMYPGDRGHMYRTPAGQTIGGKTDE